MSDHPDDRGDFRQGDKNCLIAIPEVAWLVLKICMGRAVRALRRAALTHSRPPLRGVGPRRWGAHTLPASRILLRDVGLGAAGLAIGIVLALAVGGYTGEIPWP